MKIFLSFLVLCISTSFAAETENLALRQQEFRGILLKQKTSALKVKKAESMAQDKKSKFRIDAINYLIDEKSPSSEDLIVRLIQDDDVAEFAIYGAGELELYEATQNLIQALKNENQNIRGNAFRTLQLLYSQDFHFQFNNDDSLQNRNKVIQNIEDWWKTNQDVYNARAKERKSPKAKKDAQERWDKYGKNYLSR